MVVIQKLDRNFLRERITEFMRIDKNIPFDPPWTEENFIVDLPGKWKHSFVALEGARIIGFSIASVKDIDDRACGYLHRIAISQEFQNRGVGGMLIEALEESLREAAIDLLFCSTNERNLIAQEFYDDMGFSKSGSRDIQGHKWDLYEKKMNKGVA